MIPDASATAFGSSSIGIKCSTPTYKPSVFSRINTRSISSNLPPGTNVRAGRTFAYREYSSLNRTFADLKPPPTGVVSGAFSASKPGFTDIVQHGLGQGIAGFLNSSHTCLEALPLEGCIQDIKYFNGGVRYFRANAITLNKSCSYCANFFLS